ncbi:hypothetical protein BGZ61DRAFT_168790 [Ilyonectria robusta]|uniref:uncharacterized protein n=1 Tax=Ilyonectria robusta TaxID=1079257 RepID=UPI001E8DBE0E|nr:uncharacterized protein BGZ61DRAFT_168790 [Ilyonectria robusta]KAH8733984.1 hypothetical protein BGZ61DRAFT_168790 [Ilyonectria robusta]
MSVIASAEAGRRRNRVLGTLSLSLCRWLPRGLTHIIGISLPGDPCQRGDATQADNSSPDRDQSRLDRERSGYWDVRRQNVMELTFSLADDGSSDAAHVQPCRSIACCAGAQTSIQLQLHNISHLLLCTQHKPPLLLLLNGTNRTLHSSYGGKQRSKAALL